MQRVAVFVDAGYLWAQLQKMLVDGERVTRNAVVLDYSKMHDALLAEVHAQFPNMSLLRVYWYDGPSANGKDSGHKSIDRLDNFKLRMGTLNGVGQQKAVDGLIIADMVSLTQLRAITDALLITGDADITPGVVASQAMGLRVHLLGVGAQASQSPYLTAEVDRKINWNLDHVKKFAQPKDVSVRLSSALIASAAVGPSTTIAVLHSQDEIDISVLADHCFAHLMNGSHRSAVIVLKRSVPTIPREIDRCILGHALFRCGRKLTDEESRTLRSEFKTHLAPDQ